MFKNLVVDYFFDIFNLKEIFNLVNDILVKIVEIF